MAGNNVLQILRSATALSRPTGRAAGELYWNDTDQRFGVVNIAGTAIDVGWPDVPDNDLTYARTRATGDLLGAWAPISPLKSFDSLRLNIATTGTTDPVDPVGDGAGSGDAFNYLSSLIDWCSQNLGAVGTLRIDIAPGTYVDPVTTSILLPSNNNEIFIAGTGGAGTADYTIPNLYAYGAVNFTNVDWTLLNGKEISTLGRLTVSGTVSISRSIAAAHGASLLHCQGPVKIRSSANLTVTGNVSGAPGSGAFYTRNPGSFVMEANATVNVDNQNASGSTVACRFVGAQFDIAATSVIDASIGVENDVVLEGACTFATRRVGAIVGTINRNNNAIASQTLDNYGHNAVIQNDPAGDALRLSTTAGHTAAVLTGFNDGNELMRLAPDGDFTLPLGGVFATQDDPAKQGLVVNTPSAQSADILKIQKGGTDYVRVSSAGQVVLPSTNAVLQDGAVQIETTAAKTGTTLLLIDAATGHTASVIRARINNIDFMRLDADGSFSVYRGRMQARRNAAAMFAAWRSNSTAPTMAGIELRGNNTDFVQVNRVDNGGVSGATVARFDPEGTAIGSTVTLITAEKGDIRYAAISSERFKDDVDEPEAAPTESPTAILDQMKAHSWTWGGELPESSERYGEEGYGLIAEEVDLLFPQAVTRQWVEPEEVGDDEDPLEPTEKEILGLDPLALIGLLIEDRKDLVARIEALEAAAP